MTRPIIKSSPDFRSFPARVAASRKAVIGPASMVAAPPPTAPLSVERSLHQACGSKGGKPVGHGRIKAISNIGLREAAGGGASSMVRWRLPAAS
jgi:hypothetical protein